MSQSRSSLHGWRARAHYLTRSRSFLLRTSAVIVLLGFIIACLIVALNGGEDSSAGTPPPSAAKSRLLLDYRELRLAETPQPRKLALLLRQILAQAPKESAARKEVLALCGSSKALLGWDLAPLLVKHATQEAPAALFEDFIAAALVEEGQALQRLQAGAAAHPPQMLAAEFCAVLSLWRHDPESARHYWYVEGVHFPDAAIAREEAVHLAVVQQDTEMLRAIAAVPGWLEACSPYLQNGAASVLNDVLLQWRSLVTIRLSDLPAFVVSLAAFAAALWYFILVQHDGTGSGLRRWLWPMPAVTAGIFSVWPTLTLLAWQEHTQGMSAEAPFPHDLVYYVLGVGLREEISKLALFALFLPWLLWRRQPGLALLTGAFVGLGFALEENIDYYQEVAGGVAWGRFVSANFLHVAMTGICGHALYEMLRTRFGRADQFIAAFAAVVAAHGVYDWLLNQEEHSWMATALLILTVSRFIDLLRQETRPFRVTISPLAVFTLGSAALIAAAFLTGALTTGTLKGIAESGLDCIAAVPVAMLYWRRFEHA